MSFDNTTLYQKLHECYKAAHPFLKHSQCDIEVSALWSSLKKDEWFPECARKKIQELKEKVKTKKGTLDHFWKNLPAKKSVDEKRTESPAAVSISELGEPPTPVQPSTQKSQNVTAVSPRQSETPRQLELTNLISVITIDLGSIQAKRNIGMATDDDLKRMSDLRQQLKGHQQKLNRLKSNQISVQKLRDKNKRQIQTIQETNPDLAQRLKVRKCSGRPRLEEDQPDLLEAIRRIALHGAAADSKRSSEVIRTAKTLDDLHTELEREGFKLSRNSLYLRLQPKRPNSCEGRRHVVTAPVRLIRATNDLHKRHCDTEFCRAAISYLEELASFLGPKEVLFLSQDDKARVPIGKTAAIRQAPIIMHMEYRIKLPDHDWAVADRHKLIPSVYAVINVAADKTGDKAAVGYSGPTFVAIRSGKHSSSTALSHGTDLDSILNHHGFVDYCKTETSETKPVMIICTDGGPDENPRYEKVQDVAISHFLHHNLDAIFLATNAPGRSAFNRVERRMAPLSRELAGLILPHDTFGTHLDNNGKTIDVELEKQNFERAGEILAEIWSDCNFDNYPTYAKYIPPEQSESFLLKSYTNEWRSKHVREGHYFFQVVKCKDEKCCSKPRSNIHKILNQFIPAPLYLNQGLGLVLQDEKCPGNDFCNLLLRLKLNDAEFANGPLAEVPFDLCCPSTRELLESRQCKKCQLYHASIKSLKSHLRDCRQSAKSHPNSDEIRPLLLERLNQRPVRVAAQRQREKMIIWTTRLNDCHADWVDEDELVGSPVETNIPDAVNEGLPVIDTNIYMAPVWEDDR